MLLPIYLSIYISTHTYDKPPEFWLTSIKKIRRPRRVRAILPSAFGKYIRYANMNRCLFPRKFRQLPTKQAPNATRMSRASAPLRLQRYLLSLESNVPASSCYASAYLEVKLREDSQTKGLSETVSRANQRLSRNVQQLREGYYDARTISFSLDPCYPLQLDLPHEFLPQITRPDSYSNGDKDKDVTEEIYRKYFEGRPISPANLDCHGWWPADFKYVGSKIRTSDFHVSLLPLIRFKSDSDIAHFHRRFEQILEKKNPTSANIQVKFQRAGGAPVLEILPKHDYNKLFLAMCISRNDSANSMLNEIQLALAHARFTNTACPGHVTGELDDNSVVDWAQSLLHMSIGVCNRGEGCSGFGQNELFYTNQVLLPSDAGEDSLLLPETEQDAEGRVVFVWNGEKLVY